MPKTMDPVDVVRLTARIPVPEYERLKKIAIAEGRSINAQMIIFFKVAFGLRDRAGRKDA